MRSDFTVAMTTLVPFASSPGADLFTSAMSGGEGIVVAYVVVSIFGSAAIRFFDARGGLLEQIEVATPSGFASCDRIFASDDGFVAVWRGNEIHGGIVLARRGDALARVWRSTWRAELDGVAPAPALGGVFAWGPRDIFLVRADGTGDRFPFEPAPERRIASVVAWDHDVVVVHAPHEGDGDQRFACLRGDGTALLEGIGRPAIPVNDTLLVWRDAAVVALDRGGVEVGRLSSDADATPHDLLGRSRLPFLVLDDGDLVMTLSAERSVVRWNPRADTARWRTPALSREPSPRAPPMRVGRFIAVLPATHARNGSPLWILDAATGELVHELAMAECPYHACTAGPDVVATSCYGNASPVWRGFARDAAEVLSLPHARECLYVCSPAPGVVVTGDSSKLHFFRV